MRKLLASFLLFVYSFTVFPVYAIADEIGRNKIEKENLVKEFLSREEQNNTRPVKRAEKLIKAKEGGEVELLGAKVIIPENALEYDTIIRIEALYDIQDPQIDGLDNATLTAPGFRFLPSGEFKRAVEVHIPYTPTLSKAKRDELKTYFFDEKENSWTALERIGLDEENCILISKTTHFTDMINATLSIPETVKETDININSIKSLEAARPDSHLLKFNPPSANNTGDASFSFVLDIPQGRRGMQPEISVYHMAGSGNGLLGKGFGISYSSEISTDTRNGLPGYDTRDIYTLDGVILKEKSRNSDFIEYTPLRENNFRRIRRFNPNKENEYWQVTEKTGLVKTYGNTQTSRTGVVGKVFTWHLTKEEDTYGNTIAYNYTKHENKVYIDTISYTGFKNTENGKHKIHFTYEERDDKRLDARVGFVITSAKILKQIETYYENQILRTYTFSYNDKTLSGENLLTSLKITNETGESYSYYFSYTQPESDDKGRVIYFDNPVLYSTTGEIETGRATSRGNSFNASAGFGYGLSFLDAHASAGVSASSSTDNSYSDDMLLDINSDGMPDLLTQSDDGTIYVSLNTGSSFKEKQSLRSISINRLNNSETKTTSTGFNTYAGVGAALDVIKLDLGVSYNKTTSSSTTDLKNTFMDADGDRRLDLLIAGKDYYYKNIGNDENGIPLFSKQGANFSKTEDVQIKDTPRTLTDEEKQTLDSSYYLQTPFRMWRAEKSGVAKIKRTIKTEKSVKAYTYHSSYKPGMAEIQDTLISSIPLLENSSTTHTDTITLDSIKTKDGLPKAPHLYFITTQGENQDENTIDEEIEIEYEKIKPLKAEYNPVIYENKIYPTVIPADVFDDYLQEISSTSLQGDKLFEYYDNFAKNIVHSKTSNTYQITDPRGKQIKAFYSKYPLSDNLKQRALDYYTTPFGKINFENSSYFYGKKKDNISLGNARSKEKIGSLSKAESGAKQIVIAKNGDTPIILKTQTKEIKGIDNWKTKSLQDNTNTIKATIEVGDASNIQATLDIEFSSLNTEILLTEDEKTSLESSLSSSRFGNYFEEQGGNWIISSSFIPQKSKDEIISLFQSYITGSTEEEKEESKNAIYADYRQDTENLLNAAYCLFPHKYTSLSYKIEYNQDSLYGIEKDENGNTYYTSVLITDTGAIESVKVPVKAIYNSKDDFSTIDRADNRIIYSYSKTETLEIDGKEIQSQIDADVKILEDEFLYGGVNGWHYGIFNGRILTENDFGEKILNKAMMDAEKKGEMSKAEAEVLKKKLADGDIDILSETGDSAKFYLPQSNKQDGETLQADSNSYTQGKYNIDFSDTLIGNLTVTDDASYFMPFITDSFIHSERIKGDEYYNIEGIKEEDDESTSFALPSIRRTFSTSTEVVPKASVGITTAGFSFNLDGVNNIDKVFEAFNSTKSETQGSATRSEESISKQFLSDMNSDGILDLVQVSDLDIQTGKREMAITYARKKDNGIEFYKKVPTANFSYLSKSKSIFNSVGASIGPGGFIKSYVKPDSKGNPRNIVVGGTNPGSATGSGGFSFSTSSFLSLGGLYDINADGLSDHLTDDGFLLGTGINFDNQKRKYAEDLIPSKSTSAVFSINFSLSKGFDTMSSNSLKSGISTGIGVSYSSSSSNTEEMLFDINSDGLLDIIQMIPSESTTSIKVRYNHGTYIDDEDKAEEIYIPSWNSIIDGQTAKFALFTSQHGFDLGYINKVPVIGTFASKASNGMAVNPFGLDAKKNANSLSWNQSITLALNGNVGVNVHFGFWFFGSWHFTVSTGAGTSASTTVNGVNVTLRDLDGDGRADHILSIPGEGIYYKRNKTGEYYRLNKIFLPQGGVINLAYEEIKGTENSPGTKLVLSSVTYTDNKETQLSDRFEYEKPYYDRQTKEDYGFETVTTLKGYNETTGEYISKTTDTYFNRDYYSKGIRKQTKIFDENNNLYSQTNTYLLPPPLALISETQDYTFEPEKTTEYILQNTYYSYDDYGNITEEKKSYLDGTILITRAVYDNSNINDYILSLPVEITLLDSNNLLLRKKEGDYNNQGLLIRQRQYTSQNNYSQTEFEYDDYGNITALTNPLGVRKEIEYDNTLHSLPVKISTIASDNSDALSSTIEYDIIHQVKTKETDPNGNFFSYTYDNWNRLKTLRTAYDSEYGIPAVEYNYFISSNNNWYCITNNKVSFDTRDNRIIQTVLELDGIARVKRTSKTGLVYKNGEYITGWNTSGVKEYDLAGQTIKEGMTDFIQGDSISDLLQTPINLPSLYTSYTYDCLERIISTILPDESETVQEYSIKDGKEVTTSTDSLGNITEITKNERDLTTHIARLDSDYNLLTETSYIYTDIGELIEVIDANGNKITSTYDLAGRRLSLESKDTGLRTWAYDNAGNITEESNSVLREKEQSITYHYDTFGRLILKDYPNLKDTIYTYGKSTDENLAGRLIKREDSSGNIVYEYGKLGEITKETRTLESFINYMDVGQFVTKDFEYKSNYLGQMEEITYPDGEAVTYSYDNAGQVNAITGINTLGDVFEYVKKIGYDEYSQRTLIEYGSGVVTEYSYDPQRRWLKTMKSVNSKGEILQNYTYTFDTAGNVLSYINDCLGSSYQTTEQKYTYDALYQLIKVEGECKYSSLKDNYVERDDTYSQVFQYDNIGNLIRKTSTDSGVSGKAYTDYLSYNLEYDYNPDYAHRLNKIGRYYYQYDSNGNITAYSPTSFEPEYDIKIVQVNDKEWYLNYNILEGPKLKKRTPSWQRTIFYDDRNQMCEVSDFNSGKQNAYYHYDEDGKRTSKLIWNLQEVLSFGELFSLWLKPSNKWELGQTQKSIMLGNTRLVSKIDSATKGSIRRWKDEHTFYYLQDHIGTANFITTYEGEIYQITEYTPYGERWIERTQNKYNEFYLPYRFVGKPLDEETGWYYFGARYYDPKYQIWTTSDPALSDYFSDTQKGEGGVFNHINLNTYHYAGNNPIKYVDPDGKFLSTAIGGIAGGIGGGISALFQGKKLGSKEFWAGVAGGAISGAIAGAAIDITLATGGTGAIAVAAVATGGAIGGAAGSMTESAICGDKIKLSNAMTDAIIGGASAALGFKFGNTLSDAVNSAIDKFVNKVGESALSQLTKGSAKIAEILTNNSERIIDTISTQGTNEVITIITDILQDVVNPGLED